MISRPALTVRPAAGPGSEEPESGDPAISTVLIVDDSPSVCLAIRRMLQSLDCRILEARSGHQALAMLEAEVPDVVLCDMLLEDVPGAELCRRLRESDALRHVGVVLISGQAPEEMVAQASGAGANGLLRKPFRAETLIAEIRAAVAAAGHLRQGSPAPTPTGAEELGTAVSHLEALVRLPAFRSCSWRLSSGRCGHRGHDSAGLRSTLDPETLLKDLAETAAAQSLGSLRLVCLETARGEALILGRRPGAGVLWVSLGPGAIQGRARHLVRMFLYALPRSSTASLPRKESSE